VVNFDILYFSTDGCINKSLTYMGSHSVICHTTQVNTPRLNPSQTGFRFTYIWGMEGWADLGDWLHGLPAHSTNLTVHGQESGCIHIDTSTSPGIRVRVIVNMNLHVLQWSRSH